MQENTTDIEALAEAFEMLTKTTQSMEEAYRGLEARVDELDRELAEKNRELALTTDYLGNLLESMSDGVIAVDRDEMVTRFNQAAGKILGYRAAEIVGQNFSSAFGREFAQHKGPGEQELKAKSGRMVPINERDSAIKDHAGKPLGQVKTFQDLSELIALREQVRQIDRLAALGEMAASVAHEIRNPLGGIRGFAAFLAQDIETGDPCRRWVDKILEGAKSLDKVVNGLLEYTRPVELNLRHVACAEVAAAAIEYVKHDPDKITITNEVDPGLVMLADPDQVRQVFLNILLNAVQSMDEGGAINIAASADDTDVTLSFKDTGHGMDEEQLSQVFSPFFTTKEKGTGLGMAVSMKIVEGHGGTLNAESEPGAGTTISVRLPRAE